MVSAVPRSRHVELTAPGAEFLRHLAQTLGARLLAHLVRDAHGAELRPAHRAEMRELVALLRQRRIVEGAGGLGIERQIELVLPAEIEDALSRASALRDVPWRDPRRAPRSCRI